MSEALGILLIVSGGALTLTALFAVTNALFPQRCAQTRLAAESMPGRAFLIGLVNALFLAALVLGFIALSEATGWDIFVIPAVAILAVLTVGVAFGLTGVTQLIGDRLFPERGALQRAAWGTLSLYFASLTPFVGWFGVLGYTALLGLGAFILSFFRVNPLPESVGEDV